MLKKLGGLLDLLLKLKQAWPLIVVAISIVLAVLLGLAGIGKRVVQVSLYLPAVIVFVAMALYPIAKLVEWFVKRKREPLFEYAGLLWSPSIFHFGSPKPICPVKECGCEVTCTMYQPSLAYVHGIPTGHELHATYTYVCPIHGTLSRCPNDEIAFLQTNARKIQNRKN